MGDAGTLSVAAQDALTGAGVQTVTGAKTFKNQKLLLKNPADTFTATITNPAVTADTDLEMQVAPGGSDIVYVYKNSVSSTFVAKNARTGAIISSAATPDAPIAAALALGSVRFSGDDFVLSGGFAGFSIGANCTVSCSASTFFTVPQGYTGYVFKMGTGNPSYFQGGHLREGGTPAHLWTGFQLQSSTASGLRTRIADVQIDNPGTGIKLLVDNVAGYINSCYIGNLFIFQPVIGIDFDISGTTWSGGDAAPAITHNTFDSVVVQCYAGTTHGFRNIQNCDNVFLDCNSWDANTGNAGAGCYRSHFHPTSNLVASHPIIQGIMTSPTASLFSDTLGAASIWDRYTGIKPNKKIDATLDLGNNAYQIKCTQAIIKQGGTSQFYIRTAADSAYGNIRLEKLELFSLWSQDGVNNFVSTSGGVWKFVPGIVHDNYIDRKTITVPADPASTYTRQYAKIVDTNNDGYFVKRKINGAVVEVQL